MNNPKDNPRIIISKELHGATAATAANYGKIFIATSKCVVKKISAVWTTASSSGTLQVQRLQGTETSGNGDDLLSSVIAMSGIAETTNEGTLTTTVADLILHEGDRLMLEDAGTLTSQAGLCVSIELELVD